MPARDARIFVDVSRGVLFYVGLALLLTHEMDAMVNHEWRVLPLLRNVGDALAEDIFVLAHVPLYAIVIAFVASLNTRIRERARLAACGFLFVHAILHAAFSDDANYEFDTLRASLLIYGAAACGLTYLAVAALTRRPGRP